MLSFVLQPLGFPWLFWFALSLFSLSPEVPGPGAGTGPDAFPGCSRKPEASCCKGGAALASQQGRAFAAWWSSSRSGGPDADMAEMGRWHCLGWAGG